MTSKIMEWVNLGHPIKVHDHVKDLGGRVVFLNNRVGSNPSYYTVHSDPAGSSISYTDYLKSHDISTVEIMVVKEGDFDVTFDLEPYHRHRVQRALESSEVVPVIHKEGTKTPH